MSDIFVPLQPDLQTGAGTPVQIVLTGVMGKNTPLSKWLKTRNLEESSGELALLFVAFLFGFRGFMGGAIGVTFHLFVQFLFGICVVHLGGWVGLGAFGGDSIDPRLHSIALQRDTMPLITAEDAHPARRFED